MSSTRRLTAIISALALVGALAGTTLAGGPSHASATFVDATGATIGWARLVEDATGRVHVNIHVRPAPGLPGIRVHAVGACRPTFAAASGADYNPLTHQHGLENPAGPMRATCRTSSSTAPVSAISTRSRTA